MLPLLVLCAVIFHGNAVEQTCTPSRTTASGSEAPSNWLLEDEKASHKPVTYEFKSFTGTICSGDLIFEDNFDFFDFKKWEHENTLGGGGVSIYA